MTGTGDSGDFSMAPPDGIEEKEVADARGDDQLHDAIHVEEMFQDWFLDYASYVIMDRAVPYMEDGLKPVQRRILHSLKELDDGRFNKVANVIGNTMKYHPHGDAAIGDAIVNLGQKELLIDTQGNWGNIYTGDRAAAPRYIEARLSKFGNEILFSPKITEWQLSYDGRNQEPVTFPVKFPLLLAQGVEGIAVGLSTKVMPHNFVELLKASIKLLQGKRVKLYPDFATGGTADVSNYNDGKRGSRIRVRAHIEIVDNKTLAIRDLPYGKSTGALIESILSANDKGKIRIKKVEDNTARDVEILVYLPSGVSPDVTVDALYAFTDCEISLAPNCCIIQDDQPRFIGVTELLEMSTMRTRDLLRQELEIKLGELENKWHMASLEKIFIENRIYRDIEECETWEAVLKAIDDGLKPHIGHLRQAVTEEDLVRLTEIKIKRISKYDSDKADALLKQIEGDIAEVKHHLEYLTDYAITWFEMLLKKYGKGRERKTELKEFSAVDATRVAAANVKIYVNREEGFVGSSLKKDEYLFEASDIDDLIVFLADGSMVVTKVANKTFIGPDIIHVGVWQRGDERTIYHMIYQAGKGGTTYAKRFAVASVTRDRPYQLASEEKGSKVHYFSANPQGEGEIVTVHLRANAKARKMTFDFDMSELAVKGRGARGNTLTKHPVKRVDHKERLGSTLAGIEIWFDSVEKRLNTDERGQYLGSFKGDDSILALFADGTYMLTTFDLHNQYQGELLHIEKYRPGSVMTVVYTDGEREDNYVKRFSVEEAEHGKRVQVITDHPKSRLLFASMATYPRVQLQFRKEKGSQRDPEELALESFIDVKGLKSLGNKLSRYNVRKVVALEPLPEPEQDTRPEDTYTQQEEVQPTLFGDDDG